MHREVPINSRIDLLDYLFWKELIAATDGIPSPK
jgi:hypothetical protein